MTNPTFFTVVADFKSVVVDLASDVDADPTLGPVTAKVTFTPILANGDVILATDASPRPTGYVAAPIVARIDADGRLKLRVEPDGDRDDFANVAAFPATGNTAKVYFSIATQTFYRWTGSAYAETYPYAAVRLLADTALLELSTDLYYRVSFSEVIFNGGPGYLAPFTFQAPTSDVELNLIEVMRQPGQPASGITKIAPGGVRLQDGNIVFSFASVDIPNGIPFEPSFNAAEITDATATGRSLLTAASAAAARTAISAQRSTQHNVLDYGATGNGTTDDTAAIHATRDAAGVGGTVVVPAGTYRISSLSLNIASQVWQIMPGATLKLLDTGYPRSAINVTAEKVTITGGGTIDGNRATLGDNRVSFLALIIGMVTASDLRVQDVTVKNSSQWGIWGQGNRTRVLGCSFSGSYAQDILLSSYYLAVQIGSTMQDSYDMEASHNFVDRSSENPATTPFAAIQLRGNTGTGGEQTAYRPKATFNTVVLPVEPANVNGGVVGIEIALARYGLAQGNRIINGNMGISFAKAQYGTAIGNHIIGPNLFGVELSDSPGSLVQGNTIDGLGLLDKSSGSGITSQGASSLSSNCTLVGNRIFNVSNTTRPISAASVSAWTVTGNSIEGKFGMNFTTLSDSVVSGNTIKGVNTGSLGVALTDCSSMTLTGNTFRDYNSGVYIAATSGTSDHINVTGNHFRTCATPVDGVTSGGGAIGTNVINANNTVRA